MSQEKKENNGTKIEYSVGNDKDSPLKINEVGAKVEAEHIKGENEPRKIGESEVGYKSGIQRGNAENLTTSNGYTPQDRPNQYGGASQNQGNTGKSPSLPSKGGLDPEKKTSGGLDREKAPGGSAGPAPGGPAPVGSAANPKEQAPDLGKNYGGPGAPNQPGRNIHDEPKGEGAPQKPGANTPENNPVPPVTPTTTPENGAGADELGKKGGLEDEKSELEDKKGQEDSQEKTKPEDEHKAERKGAENPSEGEKKDAETTHPPQQRQGNGYGALDKQKQENSNASRGTKDSTASARKNLEQSKKESAGRAEELGKKQISAKVPRGSINDGKLPFASRARQGLANFFNRGNDKEGTAGGSGVGHALGKKILDFITMNPYVLLFAVLALVIIMIILLSEGDIDGSDTGGTGSCTYSLKGVVSGTESIELSSIEVELVNCDAKAGNYTVLETIDFEKYVVGVALAEVSWHADYPAYFQAQIVAARGFALKRNSAMCPSHPDNCFYGYNASTGKIRMRACTNDQVYCDYDKPCYHLSRSGKPTLYGPEAEGMAGATVWKGQLDESTKAAILAAAEEVKGKVLTDSDGNVIYTNFVNTDQQEWWRLAKEGKNYEEILVEHYSSKGASGMSSGECSSYGDIDYGDYQLSSDDDTILHERLDTFLSNHGSSLEEYANTIKSNVEEAGYGTRAGVVVAAVTLIAELGNKYNVKIPYFWGGGHYDGVVDGPLGYWGSTECHTYANNQSYDYCGFDCSGFVPWAIKNGGFEIGHMLASNFQYLSGAQRVSLDSSSPVLQAGDLLESEGHIVLVVGVDEQAHQYICAEAAGNKYGVLFTRRSYADSGYWGVKMDGYYSTHARK